MRTHRGTYFTHTVAENKVATALVLVTGVVAFAVMFAVNSSVHSYLIVSYSNKVREKKGVIKAWDTNKKCNPPSAAAH